MFGLDATTLLTILAIVVVAFGARRFGREPGKPWTFSDWALILAAFVLATGVIAKAVARYGR
jgi:hypothetical protein